MLSPKGRDRPARFTQGNRRTPNRACPPVRLKSFSPSRLEIKKGKSPSPTVSDGRQTGFARRSAGGRIGERGGIVTRKVGRGGVAVGWFHRSSHRCRGFATGNVGKWERARLRRAADAAVGSLLGVGWVTPARAPGNGGAPVVGRGKEGETGRGGPSVKMEQRISY